MSGQRQPVLFLGHGNPLHALADNPITRAWAALGRALPRPRAVVVASAHWCTRGFAVGGSATPKTLHDFGGFPAELYRVRYPAPGDPALAREMVSHLAAADSALAPVLDPDRPLDHGIWCPLLHIFPGADLPVLPLSVDPEASLRDHFALGRALRPLRDAGVLLVGSGNLIHNLAAYQWRNPQAPAAPWAREFELTVLQALEQEDHERLLDAERLRPAFHLAAPTPEHYLPLPVILGACHFGELPAILLDGFEGGSLSMLSLGFGFGKGRPVQ